MRMSKSAQTLKGIAFHNSLTLAWEGAHRFELCDVWPSYLPRARGRMPDQSATRCSTHRRSVHRRPPPPPKGAARRAFPQARRAGARARRDAAGTRHAHAHTSARRAAVHAAHPGTGPGAGRLPQQPWRVHCDTVGARDQASAGPRRLKPIARTAGRTRQVNTTL